jgi:hypothetical protein
MSNNAMRRRREHFFYTGMAVVVVATVFAGFARTYYLKAYTGTPLLPVSVHLHGIVFAAWTLLFLGQTVFIGRDRINMQRGLGIAGAGLACLMGVLGYEIAIAGARRGFLGQFPDERGSPSDPLAFLIIGLGDLLLFLVFFTLGLYYRSQPEVHKRLMLLAPIDVLPAAVTRIPLGAARLPVPFTLLLALSPLVHYTTACHEDACTLLACGEGWPFWFLYPYEPSLDQRVRGMPSELG